MLARNARPQMVTVKFVEPQKVIALLTVTLLVNQKNLLLAEKSNKFQVLQ